MKYAAVKAQEQQRGYTKKHFVVTDSVAGPLSSFVLPKSHFDNVLVPMPAVEKMAKVPGELLVSLDALGEVPRYGGMQDGGSGGASARL